VNRLNLDQRSEGGCHLASSLLRSQSHPPRPLHRSCLRGPSHRASVDYIWQVLKCCIGEATCSNHFPKNHFPKTSPPTDGARTRLGAARLAIVHVSSHSRQRHKVLAVIVLASVSSRLPWQNGHAVGRSIASLNRNSDIVGVYHPAFITVFGVFTNAHESETAATSPRSDQSCRRRGVVVPTARRVR